MDLSYLSPAINVLLVIAFIIDRVYRLKSSKEFKQAKEAQIENLRGQLAGERANNDVQLTELHKKRYENLKTILTEQELELSHYHEALLELQLALENQAEKAALVDMLLKELNRVEKIKHTLETEKKALLSKIEE